MQIDKPNQKFDSTVIGVIEGVIDLKPLGNIEYLMLDEEKGSVTSFDPLVIRAFSQLQLFGSDESSPAYDYLKKIIDSCDPKVLETLLEGRSRLFLLLNSPGGSGLIASWLNKVNSHVKNNRGETYAYGTDQVSSAATHLWREADYRTLLDYSLSVWHTHVMLDGSFDPQQREVERQQLLQYFENAGKKPEIDKIIDELRKSTNAEVCLTGHDLFTAGLSTTAFDATDEMRDDFLMRSEHSIEDFDMGKSQKGPNLIRQFFAKES